MDLASDVLRPSGLVAGLVYESLGHTHIVEGITFALKSMRRREERSLSIGSPRGEEHASNSMDVGDSKKTVHFPAHPEIVFESSRPQAGLTNCMCQEQGSRSDLVHSLYST